TPLASWRTKPSRSSTTPGLARPSPFIRSATRATRAEPTTAASATLATAAACSGVLMPKPTATGTSGRGFRRADGGVTPGGAAGRAGGGGDRHVVEEAAGVAQRRRQPFVVGGRRRQADEVRARLERRQAQLRVLFRRQVDDDEAVGARRLEIGEEAVDAVL